MSETPGIPNAATEVANLYVGNYFQRESQGQNDKPWQEIAQRFGTLSEQITSLGQAIIDAGNRINAYPGFLKPIITMTAFSAVEDEIAQSLLTDLLIARSTSSPGTVNYKLDYGAEADAMATELGCPEGRKGDMMRLITPEQVIESVLSGKLRITTQR